MPSSRERISKDLTPLSWKMIESGQENPTSHLWVEEKKWISDIQNVSAESRDTGWGITESTGFLCYKLFLPTIHSTNISQNNILNSTRWCLLQIKSLHLTIKCKVVLWFIGAYRICHLLNFQSPIIPSFLNHRLQSWQPPFCLFSGPSWLLPQGLCSYCLLCQELSSTACHSLTTSLQTGLQSNRTCSESLFLTMPS